jgi:putative tricarboxylic transport membrane protein
MRLPDGVTGGFLAALGGVTVYGASFLPPIPGQQIGPSIFPTVVGAGLILCGLLIALGIGRRFEDEAEADLASHQDASAPAAAPPMWLAAVRTLVPIGAILFYVLTVNTLGFVAVAALMVGVTAYALRASLSLSLVMAVLAPPCVHLVFYKLLRVPLPDGLLPMPW